MHTLASRHDGPAVLWACPGNLHLTPSPWCIIPAGHVCAAAQGALACVRRHSLLPHAALHKGVCACVYTRTCMRSLCVVLASAIWQGEGRSRRGGKDRGRTAACFGQATGSQVCRMCVLALLNSFTCTHLHHHFHYNPHSQLEQLSSGITTTTSTIVSITITTTSATIITTLPTPPTPPAERHRVLHPHRAQEQPV